MKTISTMAAALGATLILAGSVLLGGVAVTETKANEVRAEQVMTQAEEAIIADSAPINYDKVAVATEKSKVPAVTTPDQWIADVLASHGVTTPVRMRMSDGCAGAFTLGCTNVTWVPGTRTIATVTDIRISSRVIGTAQGVHVVLHEAGHANGIVSECGADAFAHAHGADPSFHDYYC